MPEGSESISLTLSVRQELVWWPDRGMGYYPVACGTAPYDESYFANYCRLADTEIGRRLTAWRLQLVQRYLGVAEELIDVGIGSGAFVEARRWTRGWDVNPVAIAWLQERKLLRDPYLGCHAVTCWDSLEHLPQPERLLAEVRGWIFVSLPIFQSAEHVLRSKHFKKEEHYWYWTRAGFVRWLREQGFEVVEHSAMESLIGREDIESFVARRSSFAKASEDKRSRDLSSEAPKRSAGA